MLKSKNLEYTFLPLGFTLKVIITALVTIDTFMIYTSVSSSGARFMFAAFP